ncbi:MAG: glutamine-hydrolyzing GMP synthase, partial [Bryobacteraceae bacterium]|nr:glutamine-hydrolyzing GMP synthase [Bryobacteraceae bacterium]
DEGWILPVHSVGVQGDCRSYRPALSISGHNLHARAVDLINRIDEVNRVVAEIQTHVPISGMSVQPGTLTRDRLDRLRQADAIVRRISQESGFDQQIWQFPVITIPLGTSELPDSVVLRPVDSVDGMTAQSVSMETPILAKMTAELLQVPGVCGVFYDLTHKPPGTIEWE